MRTIKFRGKCSSRGENNGKWAYGYFLRDCNGVPFIHVSGYNANFSGFDIDYPIIDETIGQFTGLHDKNGKEIYEGDILHVKLYRNAFMNEPKEFRDAFDIDDLKGELMEEFTSPVEFTECSFGIRDFYLDSFGRAPKHCYPIHDIEVIGNIHDNPELLKGGEE